MAITQAMATSFKVEILDGVHNFNGFTTTATYGSGTTAVTSIASMSGIRVGQKVTGSGIASNTFVAAIDPVNSAMTLSTATTGSGTGATLTFPADTFKIALYTSSATLDSTTTAYTTSNEVTGTGYTAGGQTLTISTAPTSTGGSGTTAWLDFDNATWTTATITAYGALIYNSSQTINVGGSNVGRAVAVLSFGGDKTSTAGDFTVQFPAPAYNTAILRIA